MGSAKQKEIIESLLEELVISRGVIKEMCSVRHITEPKASLERIERAITAAREHLKDNI